MSRPLRVAYTLEQCWHAVPGGTATSALEVARRLAVLDDLELVGVAGRHRSAPADPFTPPIPVHQLPIARPWLYESWNRFERPFVERATGPVDVCHSTTSIPAATSAPHVVTIHDVAFVDTPERFTRHGVRVMRSGLDRCRRADLVLVPSRTTADALMGEGFVADRIRVVPWGVDAVAIVDADRERVRARYELPAEFVLFVGTVEPRKNLASLSAAAGLVDIPVVAAGPDGWGGGAAGAGGVAFLGFVPPADLPALYSLATVFAYPSYAEGFGLPIVEAMAYGAPVVTSRGGATGEVAGDAAVLVDPTDIASIADGIASASTSADDLIARGRARAGEFTWESSATATLAAYREVAR